MTTITANLDRMFLGNEPWDCSNSAANLGDQAGRLTWMCAMSVAAAHESWLVSPLADAVDGMKEWAGEAGAWDRDEIEEWSNVEALAIFVQNVAGELRLLGADDLEIAECVLEYREQKGPEEILGHYYTTDDNQNRVDYYTGI